MTMGPIKYDESRYVTAQEAHRDSPHKLRLKKSPPLSRQTSAFIVRPAADCRSKGLSQRQFSLAIRDYCGTSERRSLPRESPPVAAAEERRKREEEWGKSRKQRGKRRQFPVSLFLSFRTYINSTSIFIFDTEHSSRQDVSKNLHKKWVTCCRDLLT